MGGGAGRNIKSVTGIVVREPERQRARGRGQGNSQRGRGRGKANVVETNSSLQSSPDSESSEGNQSECMPCEESAAEEGDDDGHTEPSSASRPAPHVRRPANREHRERHRERPERATPTSMWDESTVWAHNIPITRRTDTPALWFI